MYNIKELIFSIGLFQKSLSYIIYLRVAGDWRLR